METRPIPFHHRRASCHSPGSVTGLHFPSTSSASMLQAVKQHCLSGQRLHQMAIGTPAESIKSSTSNDREEVENGDSRH